MALPLVKQPTFPFTIPSSKREVRYRPFTVAEEKLVLFAKESDDIKETVNIYKQLIANCIIEKDVDVSQFASFDLELFFIALRSKSVSNLIDGTIVDDEDGKTYKFLLNLDDVKISGEVPNNVIKINDELSVVVKYPTLDTIIKTSAVVQSEAQRSLDMVTSSIESIIQGDEVFELSNYTKAEVEAFINSLGTPELKNLGAFFESLPRVVTDVTYKREGGDSKTVRLEGLEHFFA